MSTDDIDLLVRVDTSALVDQLIQQSSYEVLFDVIKTIDARVEDVDFTRQLRDFFVSEMKKEEAAAASWEAEQAKENPT